MDGEDFLEDDAAQDEAPNPKALWKNFKRMCIAILPDFFEDTHKPLRHRIASQFLTAAYDRLAEVESSLDLLQRIYEALESYEEMTWFLDLYPGALLILNHHITMIRMFLCQAEILYNEKEVHKRIKKLAAEAQFYLDFMCDFARRVSVVFYMMQREMEDEDEDEDEREPGLELAELRAEAGRWEFEIRRVLMHLLVIPWPVYAKQPHGRQRLSCDLQWGREGKRRLKSNRVRSYTMTIEI
ncbi:hypothetical protein F5Y07DRAFT_404082 [Xylaria sp. FL0933]|nr:hypothetical protein F5Y07DRAFT_404082 [Xylaria sp. FL0933]